MINFVHITNSLQFFLPFSGPIFAGICGASFVHAQCQGRRWGGGRSNAIQNPPQFLLAYSPRLYNLENRSHFVDFLSINPFFSFFPAISFFPLAFSPTIGNWHPPDGRAKIMPEDCEIKLNTICATTINIIICVYRTKYRPLGRTIS